MTKTSRIAIILLFLCHNVFAQIKPSYPVVIIGGGASGSMAAIQCARMGVESLLVEELPWVGGMLTSAGVSAIDGNHKLASGLWGEFRDSLYAHYGGPKAVETGWVSNTLFEPRVGQRIIKNMLLNHSRIQLALNTKLTSIRAINDGYQISISKDGKLFKTNASYVIDATETGEIAATLRVPSYIGMDASATTGETWAPKLANDIIQDLTYVVILKDFGQSADKTIPKPKGYDPSQYRCCCDTADPSTKEAPKIDCSKMMTYGKLPNGKYMINWPNCGNDYYLNLLNVQPNLRSAALEKAKDFSLGFIYFLQTELGYKNLGLAEDEYPTPDKLPFIPYHRESRRVKGHVMFNANHIMKPYDFNVYRTGVAVGDYPIDHHHKKNLNAPKIDFFDIKAPSYNIPLGSLIPKGFPRLIIAEKSISVSNIVNGASRLQPVVLGIGQAAGTLAAVSVLTKSSTQDISVREVQKALLDLKAYVIPFTDADHNDPHFTAIQKAGILGLYKASGIAFKWANEMWIYPDQIVSYFELVSGLRPYYAVLDKKWDASGAPITIMDFSTLMNTLGVMTSPEDISKAWSNLGLKRDVKTITGLNRREVAVLIDQYLDAIDIPVDLQGNIIKRR